jgi:hypothetical protein
MAAHLLYLAKPNADVRRDGQQSLSGFRDTRRCGQKRNLTTYYVHISQSADPSRKG